MASSTAIQTVPIKNDATLTPLIIEALQSMMLELVNAGDVQHVVVIHELLRATGISDYIVHTDNGNQLTPMKMREVYLTYIELLERLHLYAEANVFIKHSADSHLTKLSKADVMMQSSCGKCEKGISELYNNNDKPPPMWCLKCNICVSICCVCQQPIHGLIHWCPVCAHSAHLHCHKQWFDAGYVTCPTGCGHNCLP